MTLRYVARSCGEPSRPTVRAAQPMPALFTTTRSGAPVADGRVHGGLHRVLVGHVGLDEDPADLVGEGLAPPSLRSATTTVAPCAASSRAVASPRPLAPPEMIAAAPFRSMSRRLPESSRIRFG